ncbi:MAG: glycoside hydrolase, partial [Bacteroidota bacterium]|nr:glycoside hydrolase [Bacteroidota bacterium]
MTTNSKRGLVVICACLISVSGLCQVPKIYIANDDHTDYMWNNSENEYKNAFLSMLDYYMNLTESTSGLASDYQSKWNCDGSFWLRTYELNRTATQFDRLINQIKSGHITVPYNTLIET